MKRGAKRDGRATAFQAVLPEFDSPAPLHLRVAPSDRQRIFPGAIAWAHFNVVDGEGTILMTGKVKTKRLGEIVGAWTRLNSPSATSGEGK